MGYKIKSHPGMKFALVRVFSSKHPLIYHRNYVITSSKLNWNHESHCKVLNILWHHFYGLQECRPWKIVVDLFLLLFCVFFALLLQLQAPTHCHKFGSFLSLLRRKIIFKKTKNKTADTAWHVMSFPWFILSSSDHSSRPISVWGLAQLL